MGEPESEDERSIVELLDDAASFNQPIGSHSQQKKPSRQSSLSSPVSEVGSSIASSRFALQGRKSSTPSLHRTPSIPDHFEVAASPIVPHPSHVETNPSTSKNRQSWQSTKQTSVRSRIRPASSLTSLDKSSEIKFNSGTNSYEKHSRTVTSTEVAKRPSVNLPIKGTGTEQAKSIAPQFSSASPGKDKVAAQFRKPAAPQRISTKPVIMDRCLPRLPPPPKRLPPSLDHIRKANSRLNMSFDNQMFYQIVKDNLYLADRIQNAKSNYAKEMSEPPKLAKSKLEARESKELYNLARENLRISQRIIAARSTIPAPSRSQSVSRISSRPSSAASSATFNMSSRAPSVSNLSRLNTRSAWNDRWQYT
ncbi:hypothetical protein RvY_17626 [Ramazzottius varieornatus]|uniref:Uncharacterized protein n=1 Tax=Ramazzottius varieornatus TaxID=947166 RepID=A0A1D1W9P8_RAMVA|nr:hypothetical protein RvY_17626 [Ramazzottius varieornatus]